MKGVGIAMEWSIFAILQMFIITVGVSVAMWLRIRTVNQYNRALREQLAASADDNPETWLQSQLAELADNDPTAAVRRVVLEQTLNATDDFEERLTQAIATSDFATDQPAGDDAGLQAKIEALEAELQTARESTESGYAEELKALLQQFTHDSREMMACIQTLETENAELRKLLGDKAPPIEPPAENPIAATDADPVQSQAPADAATQTDTDHAGEESAEAEEAGAPPQNAAETAI